MNPKFQRLLSSVALTTWGGVLVYFYASGRIVKYLAADFHPLVLGGGLGLIVVGLFNLLTATQAASCGHDHGPEDSHDHESLDLNPIAALAILLLPLGFSVMNTKDAFSTGALAAKGLYDAPSESRTPALEAMLPTLTREIIEKQHPKNSAGFHEFSLMELFFSNGDPEMRGLVEGMAVETEGRMVKDPEGGAKQRRIYRLFITCCAADSQAIPIIVRFKDGVPEVKEGAWMKLSGTMRFPDEGEGPIPVLEVDHSEEGTAPPEESFTRGKF
ncbi:TIGR03943 family protein [Haloferula sp. BvORR071]|uniref:TIGR03943 family putative permease subunit n=1 Tax=Haloferula sp. BvORR071 TaxID=1396141 RepID=UPI000553F95F|nr:TIGR03943 family protein [Haloferula sp. BvORR071]